MHLIVKILKIQILLVKSNQWHINIGLMLFLLAGQQIFLPLDAVRSADYAGAKKFVRLSVRLPVRLSHAGIRNRYAYPRTFITIL